MVFKKLGSNYALMQKSIEEKDALFESLKKDIKSSVLETGLNKKDILSRYGQPVLTKDDGLSWLYRLSLDFFENEKIYLYFDSNDCLLSWSITSEKQD